MNNQIIKSNQSNLPIIGTEVNQKAQKIYNVDHVENMTTENISNNYVVTNNPDISLPTDQSGSNREYYHLFVLREYSLITNGPGTFSINKNRSLTENVATDIRDTVFSLSEEALELMKTFPAIIATENNGQGTTDATHIACYGVITNIKVKKDIVEVSYWGYNPLSQINLIKNSDDLDIKKASEYNEFNRTHWTIKKVDLVNVLRTAGFRILAY